MEFGMLDGLVFKRGKDDAAGRDDDGCGQSWIKSTDGFRRGRPGGVPKDLPSALILDDILARARPAAMRAASNMGELPVTKPAGVDFAYAMLAIRRQDTARDRPRSMLIGVIVPPRSTFSARRLRRSR